MASRTAAGVADRLLPPAAKPRSNAAKGSYYRNRTRAWLEALGYAVAQLEQLAWIRRGGPPCGACGQPAMFATKRDQLAADLLAVKDGEPITFVQVKLGDHTVTDARRKFLDYPLGILGRRWVAVWTRGGHAPEIVDCTADTAETLGPVRRRRAVTERLF